jgi:hypothetical protein
MKRSFYIIFGTIFVLSALTFVMYIYDGSWGAAIMAACWLTMAYDILAGSRSYKAKKTA